MGTLEARTRGGGFPGTDGATSGHVVALPLTAREHKGPASAANSGNIVAHTLRAEGHDEAVGAFDWQKGNDVDNPRPSTMNVTPQVPTLSGTRKPAVTTAIPRRLTPRECERLQGLPDDHTRWGVTDDGKKVELADSPRYEMLGNAVSAVVPAWIGRRLMEALATERSA